MDTHCHWEWEGFDGRREELLDRARVHGISCWILPGTSRWNLGRLRRLAEEHSCFCLAPGIHPMHAEEWNSETREAVAELLDHPSSVAVGEIGLDRRIDVPWDVQCRAFEAQLELALEAECPVILHVRGAHQEALDRVRAAGVESVLWHAFSGSGEFCRQVQKLGHFVSLCGTATWPESSKVRRVLEMADPDRLLLETDAPDLAPYPHHGETCLPEYLVLTFRHVAQEMGLTEADLAGRMARGASGLFHLGENDGLA